MKKVLFFIAIFTAMVFADDPADTSQSTYYRIATKRYENYFGLAAGLTTGYGISYRHWFANKWGMQVNFFPYYDETKYPESESPSPDNVSSSDNYSTFPDSGYYNEGYFSLGVTLLRNIAETNFIRFVLYGATNLLTNYNKFDYYKNTTLTYIDTSRFIYTPEHKVGNNTKNTISLGGGGGIEFFVWRFSLHVMVGLRGAYCIETKAKQAGPTVEGGIHFRY
jgi:hypothetical protein